MYILLKPPEIVNYIFDSLCWDGRRECALTDTHLNQVSTISHSGCGEIMLVSNPIE